MRETILNHSRFILLVTGFCPEENDRFPNWCRFKGYIICLAVFSPLTFMVYSICKLSSSSVAMAQCVDIAVMYVMVIVKVASFTLYRQKILCMLKDTSNRLRQKRTIEERLILKKWKTLEFKIARLLMFSFFFNCIVYNIGPLTQKDRTLPLGGYYSEFIIKSPWYEIIYAAEVITTILVSSGMLLCDILGVFFVFHLSYEMNCTALLMEEIGKRKNHLRKSIIRYVDAYNYGQSVCSLLSLTFYLGILVCSLALCMTGTIFIKTSNPMIACKMMSSLLSLIGHQGMDCFLGEMVTTANLKVDAAIQGSSWYQLTDKKDFSSLLFVLLKNQKPLRLVVGTQCIVNLKALGDSVSWACSYMMVLKSLISNDFTK